jgi:hypothetical protein
VDCRPLGTWQEIVNLAPLTGHLSIVSLNSEPFSIPEYQQRSRVYFELLFGRKILHSVVQTSRKYLCCLEASRRYRRRWSQIPMSGMLKLGQPAAKGDVSSPRRHVLIIAPPAV